MKSHTFRSWAAALACLGMLTPQAALAAAPSQAVDGAASDVALAEGGVLSGQVVDAAGVPMAQAPVAVLVQGREVIRVASAADGTFAIGGLKGGVYEVATPGQRGVYRLWAPQTAPPSASQGVMLVPRVEVVRGQYGYAPPPYPEPYTETYPTEPCPEPCPPKGPFGRAMGWVSDHPFITAGIVATAIAVPLAVAESDDDNDPPPAS